MTDDPMDERHTAELPATRTPTYDDYLDARAAEHREIAAIPRRAQEIAEKAGARAARRSSRGYGILSLLVALVVSFIAGGLSAYNTADIYSLRQAAQQQRTQVDDALAKLSEANAVLAARGRPPVEAPPNADPSEAITAAVTARVIAQLPPTPTAEEVAGAIVPAVTANLAGPTQQRLAGLVADYFLRNPPQPGPPPTEEAIRAAVDASLAQNPPPRGEQGKQGEKGDACAPTDPACRGPRGDTGATGRGVLTGPTPTRTSDGCVWRTTYTDGTTEEHAAGEAACPLLSN